MTSDLSSLSFEQAMTELENIVRKLESGKGALEESITDYERGMALKAHCQQKLDSARLRVEKLIRAADGAIAAEPFAAE